MFSFDEVTPQRSTGVRIWPVGALLRAISDTLEGRFNPVAVQGEISGFSRASSGHCYFSLKDNDGQIRCAMFRRAAGLLHFAPRDGQLVVVSRDLSTAHYATGIASKLQEVLDDWNFMSPQLQDLYETVNNGKAGEYT